MCAAYTDRYSVTTAQHQSMCWNNHGLPGFNVPTSGVLGDVKDSVKAYRAEIADYIGKAKRARKHVSWYIKHAQDIATEATEYALFFGLNETFDIKDELIKQGLTW